MRRTRRSCEYLDASKALPRLSSSTPSVPSSPPQPLTNSSANTPILNHSTLTTNDMAPSMPPPSRAGSPPADDFDEVNFQENSCLASHKLIRSAYRRHSSTLLMSCSNMWVFPIFWVLVSGTHWFQESRMMPVSAVCAHTYREQALTPLLDRVSMCKTSSSSRLCIKFSF